MNFRGKLKNFSHVLIVKGVEIFSYQELSRGDNSYLSLGFREDSR